MTLDYFKVYYLVRFFDDVISHCIVNIVVILSINIFTGMQELKVATKKKIINFDMIKFRLGLKA